VSGPLLYTGVALLGGLGALGRLHIGVLVVHRLGRRFPWGTLAANLIAAAGAGIALGIVGADGTALALVGVGLLGSLSTFSTWMLDTLRLAEIGRRRAAGLNLALPLVAGAGVAAAGWMFGAAL
jgi:fluoride exporter